MPNNFEKNILTNWLTGHQEIWSKLFSVFPGGKICFNIFFHILLICIAFGASRYLRFRWNKKINFSTSVTNPGQKFEHYKSNHGVNYPKNCFILWFLTFYNFSTYKTLPSLDSQLSNYSVNLILNVTNLLGSKVCQELLPF